MGHWTALFLEFWGITNGGRRPAKLEPWLAPLMIAIPSLFLVEGLTEISISGLDHIWPPHPWMKFTAAHPGRMSPITSICFCLTGAYMILKASKPLPEDVHDVNKRKAFLAALLLTIGLMHCVYSLVDPTGTGIIGVGVNPMATNTGFCFALVGIYLLLEVYPESPAAKAVRTLEIPIIETPPGTEV